MKTRYLWRRSVAAVAVAATAGIAVPATAVATTAEGAGSTPVTWTCTSAPCPWGESTSGNAAVWPAGSGAVGVRLGYATSAPIYLPAAEANGDVLTVVEGTAALYAGTPQAGGHRWLVTLSAGEGFTVSGLLAGEVLSMQNDGGAFRWERVAGPAPAPEPSPTPTPTTPTPEPTPTGPAQAGAPSVPVTWACTASPCPWGDSSAGNAAAWPAGTGALTTRLGYTTSSALYLPAAEANGDVIVVVDGSASLYAGDPQAGGHRWLTTLSAGQSHTVSGLLAGEVLSLQNDHAAFRWDRVPGDAPAPEPTPTPTPTPEPTTTPDPTPTPCDPAACPVVTSTLALWHCNVPGCTDEPWVGAAVSWPSWAAYSTNARTGWSSRTVRDLDGNVIHPYMGSWADGCEVTVLEGEVLVIEWQRGTDTWRPTYLHPGDTYTIDLTSPEDGAMLESPDTPTSFTVQLRGCTPQPLP